MHLIIIELVLFAPVFEGDYYQMHRINAEKKSGAYETEAHFPGYFLSHTLYFSVDLPFI